MASLIASAQLLRCPIVDAENDLVPEEEDGELLSPRTTSNLYAYSVLVLDVVLPRASMPIAIFLSRMIIVDGFGIVKCQLTRRSGTSTS